MPRKSKSRKKKGGKGFFDFLKAGESKSYHKKRCNQYQNEIIYMKTETLTSDMKKLGYDDFNNHEMPNRIGNINYYKYLNDESIELINKEYGPDFELFQYDKIIPNLKK